MTRPDDAGAVSADRFPDLLQGWSGERRALLALGSPALESRYLTTIQETGEVVVMGRCLSGPRLLERVRRDKFSLDVVLVARDLHQLTDEMLVDVRQAGVPLVVLVERSEEGLEAKLDAAILASDADPGAVRKALLSCGSGRAARPAPEETLEYGHHAPDLEGAETHDRVYAVLSATRSPAHTLVATGLTTALGSAAPALVVDLNMADPSVAAHLDADPTQNMYMIWHDGPGSEEQWDRKIREECQPISSRSPHALVLCGVPSPEMRAKVGVPFVRHLITELASRFDYLLLDLGEELLGEDAGVVHRAALRMAGTILLVTSADIAGLKQTQATLQTLQGLVGVNVDRICLVVYGYDRSRKSGQYPPTDIEAELGLPVVAVLPYDHVAEQRALSAQQPLVYNHRSKSGRSLLDLAQRIHGGKLVLPPDVARAPRRWKLAPASWSLLTRSRSNPVAPATPDPDPMLFSEGGREVADVDEAIGRRSDLEATVSLNVGLEEEDVSTCAGMDTACDPSNPESRPYADRMSHEKELFSFASPNGSGETVRVVLNASPVDTETGQKAATAIADPLRQQEHSQEENTMPMRPIPPSESQAPGGPRLPRTRTPRLPAAKADGAPRPIEANEPVSEAAGNRVGAGNGAESGDQGVDMSPYSSDLLEARPIRSNGSRRGIEHSGLSTTGTFPAIEAAADHETHVITGPAQMSSTGTAQPDVHPDLRAYSPGASRSALQRAVQWLRTRSAAARLEDEHDARIQELNAQLSVGTHIIPFISSKGGVGKSTTSLTLGLALSQVEGAGPKLCEVNPDFANIAQLLGNAPKGRTIEHLLEHVPEVERGGYTALREYLTQWGRLDILLAPSRPEVMEQMSPESYRQAIDVLCWYSSWILLDCGTAPTQPLNHYAISRAHHVVFMSRPENATMVPTLTAVEYVAGLRRPEDKPRALRETTLVVNDVTGRDPVDVTKVRAALPEVNVQVLPHSDRLRRLLDDGTLDMHNMPVAYRRAVKVLLASVMERLLEAREAGRSTDGYGVVAGRRLYQ